MQVSFGAGEVAEDTEVERFAHLDITVKVFRYHKRNSASCMLWWDFYFRNIILLTLWKPDLRESLVIEESWKNIYSTESFSTL